MAKSLVSCFFLTHGVVVVVHVFVCTGYIHSFCSQMRWLMWNWFDYAGFAKLYWRLFLFIFCVFCLICCTAAKIHVRGSWNQAGADLCRVHYNEPRLCWTNRASWQPQGAVQTDIHDGARLPWASLPSASLYVGQHEMRPIVTAVAWFVCLGVSVCCAETDEPIKITFGVRRGLVGPKQPLLSGVGAQISSTGVIRVSPSLQWILATRHKHSFLTTSSHCFNWYTWWRKPGWAISMKRLSVWISYRSEHDDDDDDISLLVKTANDKRKCWNRKRKKKTPKAQIILWS